MQYFGYFGPLERFATRLRVFRRIIRWRDKRREIIGTISPDFEWLMIDGSHAKVHPHAAGAKGGNKKMSRGGSIPRYIWPWMRKLHSSLIEGISAE